MREVLRSNDWVMIGFAQTILQGAGIFSLLADQHARLVAPHAPGRRLPAPIVALVDHVVVQEGGGVHELHGRREADVALAAVPA